MLGLAECGLLKALKDSDRNPMARFASIAASRKREIEVHRTRPAEPASIAGFEMIVVQPNGHDPESCLSRQTRKRNQLSFDPLNGALRPGALRTDAAHDILQAVTDVFPHRAVGPLNITFADPLNQIAVEVRRQRRPPRRHVI